MLGLAEAGQVRVKGRHDRTLVAEVDLDLPKVFPLFEQMSGIRVAQGMNMGILFDAAGVESQTEGALERGAGHGRGGGGSALAVVPFGREEERGMMMREPLLAQEVEGAFGKRDVAIGVALAAANVQEHAFGVDVADLQAQAFAQAQAAGIDQGQADPVIEGDDAGQDPAHFGGREDDGQFELGIGPDQFQFVGPLAAEGFLPEELDRAEGLGGGLAGDPFDGFEVEEVLADVFGGELIGGLMVELAELADVGVVGFHRPGAEGEKLKIIGKSF